MTRIRGHLLLAAGLLGLAAYEVLRRLLRPSGLEDDRVHGAWLGICLAIEVLGLVVMLRDRRTSG